MKRKTKSGLLVLILLLAVGFAAVSTSLIINGTANFTTNNDEFNVYYSNALVNGEQDLSVVIDNQTITFTEEMSTLGSTYVLDYDVTNGSKNYDAALSITCTESNDYLSVTNEFDTITNLEATQTRSGKLTIELIKSYAGDEDKEVTITCTINANAVERDTLSEGTPAQDTESQYYVGKVVTIGNENFYVISQTEDTVTMLTKYNLSVGNVCSTPPSVSCTSLENATGLQDSTMQGMVVNYNSTAYGTTPYSSDDVKGENYSDYLGSIVEGYVNSYVSYLNSNYNISVSGRLLLKTDLDKLAGETIEFSGATPFSSYPSVPSWIYSTSYWLGEGSYSSTRGPIATEPFAIYYGSRLSASNYSNSYSFGVRPVITISKDTLNNL